MVFGRRALLFGRFCMVGYRHADGDAEGWRQALARLRLAITEMTCDPSRKAALGRVRALSDAHVSHRLTRKVKSANPIRAKKRTDRPPKSSSDVTGPPAARYLFQ